MSPYLICALVGTSTLAAAMIAFCGLQAATAGRRPKKRRRPVTLAESRPNSRRLSSIPPEDHAVNGSTPCRYEAQRCLTNGRTQNTTQERPLSSASNPAPSQRPTTESKLNSIQTIQARSAALRSKPPGKTQPGSSTQVKAPSGQGLQEHTKADPEHCRGTPRSADMVAGTSTASLPPTCEETGGTDSVCHDTNPPCEQQGILEGMDDIQTLGSPERFEPVPEGLAQSTETSQGTDVPAFLARSDKAESGLLDADLTDIDGGSLPTSTQETPRKSRR